MLHLQKEQGLTDQKNEVMHMFSTTFVEISVTLRSVYTFPSFASNSLQKIIS